MRGCGGAHTHICLCTHHLQSSNVLRWATYRHQEKTLPSLIRLGRVSPDARSPLALSAMATFKALCHRPWLEPLRNEMEKYARPFKFLKMRIGGPRRGGAHPYFRILNKRMGGGLKLANSPILPPFSHGSGMVPGWFHCDS